MKINKFMCLCLFLIIGKQVHCMNQEISDLDKQLCKSARRGNLDEIKELLRDGANVNVQNNIQFTPLRLSVDRIAWMNTHAIRFLLDAKADPNIQDNFGNTPLIKVISHLDGAGDKELNEVIEIIVKLLLDHKSNVNLKNKDGASALHKAAALSNSESLMKLLLDSGADVNQRPSENDETPLITAVSYMKVGLVKLLLKAKADPNIQDSQGWSALMWSPESKDIITDLIEAKADLSLVNKENKTVLDMLKANKSKNGEIEKILEDEAQICRSEIKKNTMESTPLPTVLADIVSEYVVCPK